jgi:hypothetical protein
MGVKSSDLAGEMTINMRRDLSRSTAAGKAKVGIPLRAEATQTDARRKYAGLNQALPKIPTLFIGGEP